MGAASSNCSTIAADISTGKAALAREWSGAEECPEGLGTAGRCSWYRGICRVIEIGLEYEEISG